MKRTVLIYTLIILNISVLFLINSKTSQANPGSFDQVVPFATPGGFLGLFDRSSGKIYFYDLDKKQAQFTLQLESLGGPLKGEDTDPQKQTTQGQSQKGY